MNTIEIENTQNGKLTRLYLGNVCIWFSYSTPVAYSIPGVRGVIVSDKGWSQTTRRHIGTIPGRRAPIPHAEFERGLDQIQSSVNRALDTLSVYQSAIAEAAHERTLAEDEVNA